jgi:hypothetical protein
VEERSRVAMVLPEEKDEPEMAPFLFQPLFGQKLRKIARGICSLLPAGSGYPLWIIVHDWPLGLKSHGLHYFADRFMVQIPSAV